jgi:pimeloyl-ACP methyl ester carboxylesterase
MSAARSMIDSVKAARNLDSKLTTRYAIDGHSQGGQGALFAGQIAPAYDGALVLRGVSAIAPVSNADLFAPIIPGTAGQGYLVMGLYGLNAVQPGFDPLTVLAPAGRDRVGVLQSGCLLEILDSYQSLHAAQLVQSGSLPAGVVAQLAHYDNPGQAAPSAPIFIVQGDADAEVPDFITDYLVSEQLHGYDVRYDKVSGATHDTAVVQSATTVADWIAARFG